MRKLGILAASVVLATATAAIAQPRSTEPTVVRGNVASLAGNVLTVKGAKGPQTVNLIPTWTVAVLKPVSPDAIQAGSFIGTAEMPQADGTGKSLEVHVFPPGVKMGEGHYGWDLKPGSMMTNGTVGQVVAGQKGSRQLQVNYSYGKRTITVPPNVPVVQITAGTRDLVKTGTPVFLVVQKAADGSLTAGSVSVGENGAKPPM